MKSSSVGNASLCAVVVLSVLCGAGTLYGNDVAVSPSGGTVTLPDGTVFDTSYTTIKEALNSGVSNGTIWIDDGTYAISAGMYFKNNKVTFRGVHGAANTILTTPYSADDTAQYYMFYPDQANAEDVSSFIGLTFRNANGTGNLAGSCITAKVKEVRDCVFENNRMTSGAGYCAPCIGVSSVGCLVSNCTFRCNGVKADGEVGVGAGAVYIGGANARVIDCVFEGNQSVSEGATCGVLSVGTDALIERCQFVTNRVGKGSSIGARTVVRACSFVSNTNTLAGTYRYGACLSAGGNDIVVERSFFTNNVSATRTCLYAETKTGVVVSNSTFVCNVATEHWCGAFDAGGNAVVSDCRFIGNAAPKYTTGAFSVGQGSIVRNTLIAQNSAAKTTGAVTVGNGCTVENVTAVGNRISAGSGVGAILGGSAETWFYNVVFADNRNASSMSHVYVANNVTHYYNCHFDSDPTTYNAADSTITTGDPLFVDAARGDYHFTAKSPLRNQGQNRDWMEHAKDLDGRRARILEEKVDIGCYEFMLAQGLMLIFR